MNPTKSAFLALLVLTTGFAQASEGTRDVIRKSAPTGITETFYGCIAKATSDLVSTGPCLKAEEAHQDQRLNARYQSLMATLKGEDKDALVRAERAWVNYDEQMARADIRLYGDDPGAGFDTTLNHIFRLCVQANALEHYAFIKEDQ
jgi:uncharacterized protein YecT (DUF1311 family)